MDGNIVKMDYSLLTGVMPEYPKDLHFENHSFKTLNPNSHTMVKLNNGIKKRKQRFRFLIHKIQS